jgi:hypothetical protein
MENNSSKQTPKKALHKTDGKLSSYQKMKQKYEASICQLTDDIITLVEEKDFIKTTTVKMKWRMRLDVENAIWFGDASCH